MRRVTRLSSLLCLPLCCVLGPLPLAAQRAPRASVGATRIAVYDSRIVFDSMPERAAVESEFALEQAKARTMLAEASDSLRQTLDEYTKAEARLSPREREAGSLHLRARELLVEEMVANLDALVLQRLEALRRPLLDRIRQAVRTVRTRQGMQLVIDLASEGVIIDADPSIDLTAAVLAELRRPAPAREPDESVPRLRRPR